MNYKNGFQAKVLTHLEYIKEKQDEHDDLFKDIYNKINDANKRINTAEGFAKGAIWMGLAGVGGGLLSWFSKLFGGN